LKQSLSEAIFWRHLLLVGHDSGSLWKQIAFVTITCAAATLVRHSRIGRPLRARRHLHQVVEVRHDRAQATTLVLEPEGEDRLRFRPGQFIMLTLGESPLAMQQHPFSIASSSLQRRLELTVSRSGDFTSALAKEGRACTSLHLRPRAADGRRRALDHRVRHQPTPRLFRTFQHGVRRQA